jgi:type I restriction enzyme S subunit
MSSHKDIRTYNRPDCAVFRKTAEAFGGLSNMAPGYPVRINGVRILTVEALYQACRFPHLPEVQRKIIDQTSPMTAKMVGKPHRGDSRPDWDRVRVKIMRWVLRVKLATHWSQFSALLLSTGNMPIVEDSRKDDFWGAMPTDASTLVGMNVLGRLLMELREEVKQGAELRRVEPPDITDLLLFGQVIDAVNFRQDKSVPSPVEHEPSRHAVHDFSRSLFDEPTQVVSNVRKMEESRDSADAQYRGLVADLKPYPAYRDTGLPWLGSCPAHWELRRMKTLFRERVQKGFSNEPLLAATQTKGVVRKEDYGTRTVTAQKDLHLLKLVEPSDYVISLRSFQGGIEVAHCRGIISPAYTVLTPKPDADSGYFTHLFKSRQFIDGLSLFVTGIREGQNIEYERLSRAEIPLPHFHEGRLIAKFLAHSNGRIDRFIRAKRKLIVLLNEQKQTIIQGAVTRGIDPHATLRSSGISWLGDIPAHWEVVRNSALFSHRVEAGIPGLQVLQVSLHSGVTTEELDQFGRPKRLIADSTRYKLIRKSDLAYNTMRMWQGAVGVSPCDGLVSPAYVVLQPRVKTLPEFYDYFFRTEMYKQQVSRESTGIVDDRLRLYWDSFKQMPSIRLPLSEQRSIVEYIAAETSAIDAAISRTQSEIFHTQEFKVQLVSAVVTGQLDVREAAANYPDVPSNDDSSALDAEILEEEPEEV